MTVAVVPVESEVEVETKSKLFCCVQLESEKNGSPILPFFYPIGYNNELRIRNNGETLNCADYSDEF